MALIIPIRLWLSKKIMDEERKLDKYNRIFKLPHKNRIWN